MVDIIIPAYKAQGFIDKALSSINIQWNLKDIKVTIVNDGYGDYSENIKRFPDINITELNYGENRGCGYARQYGIEHTKEPYIMFLDADDCLYSFDTVKNLLSMFSMDNINCVYSFIKALYKDKECIIEAHKSSIWLHGKMYRRSFLKKHNINFYFNSAGEDAGFNKQVSFNCKESDIKYSNILSYVWSDSNSQNRINTVKFSSFSSKEGLIDNFMFAVQNALYNKVDKQIITNELVDFLVDLYVQYNLFLTSTELKISEEECRDFIKWCLPVYKALKKVRIDLDVLNKTIFEKTKVLYDDFGYIYRGTKCTFEQFIELIKEAEI